VPHRNVQRFRGGLVFKAHRLCVSLNSRLESNKEEEEEAGLYPQACDEIDAQGDALLRFHQVSRFTIPASV